MTQTLRFEPTDSHLAEFFALVDRAHRADGQPPFNDQALARVRSGSTKPVLAWEGSTIVGALVRVGDEFEMVIDPGYRKRGWGGQLAAFAVHASAPGTLAWAHGDLPGSRRLAERFGCAPVRTLLQMRRPLDELPGGGTGNTGGFVIEPFRPGDDETDWLALNSMVFAEHPEQGQLDHADLSARMAEAWFDADDFLVARDENGHMIGYDWVKIDPSEPNIGEIYVLGVHPGAAGQGVGRALLNAGLERMVQRGANVAALYVEADNVPAVNLYRAAGFENYTVDVQYRVR